MNTESHSIEAERFTKRLAELKWDKNGLKVLEELFGKIAVCSIDWFQTFSASFGLDYLTMQLPDPSPFPIEHSRFEKATRFCELLVRILLSMAQFTAGVEAIANTMGLVTRVALCFHTYSADLKTYTLQLLGVVCCSSAGHHSVIAAFGDYKISKDEFIRFGRLRDTFRSTRYSLTPKKRVLYFVDIMVNKAIQPEDQHSIHSDFMAHDMESYFDEIQAKYQSIYISVDGQKILLESGFKSAFERDLGDVIELLQTIAPGHFQKVQHKSLLSHQAPTRPTSLDQVQPLCETMHEARTLCAHFYSRLSRLETQLSSARCINEEMLRNEHAAIVERFHDFLTQYGNKQQITRIISSRVIINECQALHEDLNGLMKLYEGDFEDDLEWKKQFQAGYEIQRGLLKSVLEQECSLVNELQDTEVQREALTLMLFELKHRTEKYDPEEVELISRVFHSVARYSTLGIPPLPTWFIPPHEVVLKRQIGGGALDQCIWDHGWRLQLP